MYTEDQAFNNVQEGKAQAFGWVNGSLYFGKTHTHITEDLVGMGIGYSVLLNAQQVWGWVRKNAAYSYIPENGLDINFASDKYFYQKHEFGKYENLARKSLQNWWNSRLPKALGSRRWY